MPYAGSRFDVTQPGAGEVTRLPVVLLDDDGVPVTGEAFDAAGMDVEVAKPGGTFASFPTFATENWHEVGHGVYEVVIRGDDATEAALLDTEGTFLLYVKTHASSANTALHAFKVSPYDVAREGADGDTLETLSDQIDAIDPGGAYVVTRTFVDSGSNAVANLKITVQSDSGGSASGTIIAKATTSSAGAVTFNLDAGTYHFLSPSTGVWQASDTTVTVAANSTGDITVTAQTLPAPSAADKYVIIINAADEFADSIGASAWSIKVIGISPRGLSTANLVQLTERNAITVDGNGQASFEVSQETETVTLAITPTLADGTTGATETITVEIDADKADDEGRIYLADLMTD